MQGKRGQAMSMRWQPDAAATSASALEVRVTTAVTERGQLRFDARVRGGDPCAHGHRPVPRIPFARRSRPAPLAQVFEAQTCKALKVAVETEQRGAMFDGQYGQVRV